jgi:hypothetical protein
MPPFYSIGIGISLSEHPVHQLGADHRPKDAEGDDCSQDQYQNNDRQNLADRSFFSCRTGVLIINGVFAFFAFFLIGFIFCSAVRAYHEDQLLVGIVLQTAAEVVNNV